MSSIKRKKLLDALKPGEYNNITKLANELKWPRTTLIHYINSLIEEGLIEKEHGSITKKSITFENKTQEKLMKNASQKEKISKEAASYIEEGDIVYIDSGSTTVFMMNYIKDKNIIVYTNNISFVEKLPVEGFKPQVFIVPGEIYMKTSSVIGVLATKFLGTVFIDKAFMGVNSKRGKEYITTNQEEAILKNTIIKNAKESYILFDKSKIESKIGKYIYATEDKKIKEIVK